MPLKGTYEVHHYPIYLDNNLPRYVSLRDSDWLKRVTGPMSKMAKWDMNLDLSFNCRVFVNCQY